MTESHLHVISLTIPYPANFGGAFDIWHKLRALKKAGIKTVLHCYKYNRPEAPELESVCEKVYYYNRSRRLRYLFSKEPFIVTSRKSTALLSHLTQDQSPILMEGIHCTSFLHHPALAGRKIWIRAHNVEHHYYQSMLNAEKSWLKKLFFVTEMKKLKAYETRTLGGTGLFTISGNDHAFFQQFNANCHLLTPFHGHNAVTSKPGTGTYVLYHGDLSIGENTAAAAHLASMSSHFPVPLIIAGRSPKESLKQLSKSYSNTTLVEEPPEEKMKNLIQEAAVILLPANQITGFRLKLINSLFQGRHVVASPQMLVGTGLDHLCSIAGTTEEWINQIRILVATPFSAEKALQRQALLEPFFDDNKAKELVKLIFPALA